MSRAGRPGPRARGSARGGAGGNDAQYDLLTAALIGVAIGVSTALLVSQASRLRPRRSGVALARHELGKHLERKMRGGRRQVRHVEDSMERELRALTKAIRRGRRKLGL